MLKFEDAEDKFVKILDEKNKTKIKLDEEIKLFEEEQKKLRDIHNDRMKKLLENKNKKTKALENRISELEKETTFLVGTLSIAKINNEITEEQFNGMMQNIKEK